MHALGAALGWPGGVCDIDDMLHRLQGGWALPLGNVDNPRCSAPTAADSGPLATSIDPFFLGRSLQIKGMRSRGSVQHGLILPVAVRVGGGLIAPNSYPNMLSSKL